MKRKAFILVAALILGVLTQPAAGQATIDNLVFPEGTATQPLGSLGGVKKGGDGPHTLILLAGAPFGSEVWSGFMERNAERYTMYAVTPAGYAGTSPPPLPDDPAAFVPPVWTEALYQGLLELVEKEGLERPVLVGQHLMSVHYVLRMAQMHPDRFSGVVAIAGNPYGPLAGGGTRLPSENQQSSFISQNFVPFYRTVSLQTWRAGDYPASAFSQDPVKGRAYELLQESVPLPQQLRYFLEFLSTQTRLALSEIQVPVLALLPQANVDSAYTTALNNGMSREQVEEYLVKKYGSLKKAHRELRKSTAWEPYRSQFQDVRILYPADSGLFMMADRPEFVDGAIAAFVEEVTASAED
ncbi:MAG TPA: hypothetical protein VLV83_00820 [Acidobacteriota bacterium]|nr:hypothetical protein [Acidobacteriota bacterium]